MSYGWLLDGFDSASAGFSVFDSFIIQAKAGVSKYYQSNVLKHANIIRLHITLGPNPPDYQLFDYPVLNATLNAANGSASVTGTGGSHAFYVLVLLQ